MSDLEQLTADQYNARIDAEIASRPPPPSDAWKQGYDAPTVADLYAQGYRGATYANPRTYTPQPLSADTGAGFQYDPLIEARSAGFSWDEIGNFQAMQRAQAYAAGYTQEEIREHLGFADWQNGERRNETSWSAAFSSVPALITGLSAPEPSLDLTLAPGWRQDYTQALLRGEVDGPRDFAYRYAAAALREFDGLPGYQATDPEMVKARQFAGAVAAEALSTELPTVEDLTDATIGVLAAKPGARADIVRGVLLDRWERDGTPPVKSALETGLDVVAAPTEAMFNFLAGVGEGFWWSRDDIRAQLKDAGLAESLGATFGRMVSPRAFWDMFKHNGELVVAAAKGEPVDPTEAFFAAMAAAHISRFPGGRGPVDPDILPPLPRIELPPGPRPAPKEGPIIEGEFVRTDDGPKVQLPPLPDVPLLDFDNPGVPPRMITAREAVVEPTPLAEQAVAKVAEILSLEDKINRADLLRTENEIGPGATGEAPGTFFQRKVAEMQAAGELPEGSWITMAEPTPQRLLELAEGYDNARTVAGWLTDTLGPLFADESGALRIFEDPLEKAVRLQTRYETRAAKSTIIKGQSRGEQEIIHIQHALKPFEKYYNAILPEFQAELAKGPMGTPMNTDLGRWYDFMEGVGYGPMTRRDQGLSEASNVFRAFNQWKHSELQRMFADGLIDEPGYVENYFRHMWRDPKAATNFFYNYMNAQPPGVSSGGRQGSGATLKQRTVPTFGDGLRAGLAPVETNPIKVVIADLSAMVRFKHAAYIREEFISNLGLAKWMTKPDARFNTQLTGVGVQRSVPIQANLGLRQAEATAREQLAQADAPFQRRLAQLENDLRQLQQQGASRGAIAYARQLIADETNVRNQTLKPLRDLVRVATEAAAPGAYSEFLYAPAHVAKIYNRWLSPQLGGADPQGQSVVQALMYLKNRAVGLKLAVPMFHSFVIAGATLTTGMQEAMSHLAAGKPLAAAGAAGRAIAIFPQTTKLFRDGLKAREAYLAKANDPILNMLVDAGLRIGKRQPMYQTGPETAYWEAWAANNAGDTAGERLGNVIRGAANHLKTEIDKVGGTPGERLLPHKGPDDKFHFGTAFWALPRTAKVPLDELTRALTVLNVPVFDYAIPVLKAGAAMNMFQTWLANHPNASPEIVQRRAQQIVQDVEFRFGEQNLDNIFLPNAMKQVAQLATISATWAISTWAWFYQAAKSAAMAVGEVSKTGSFKGLANNPDWNPFALQTVAGAAVVFAMMNAVWTFGHTGRLPDNPKDFINFPTGTQVSGAPQRGMLPHEFKELYDVGKIVAETYARSTATTAGERGIGIAATTAAEGIANYVYGKFNEGVRLGQTLTGGEDAIGRRPAYMPDGFSGWFLEAMRPMVVENLMYPKKDTGLHPIELLFAKEAPLWITNPGEFVKKQEGLVAKWSKESLRRAIKDNQKLENPKYNVPAGVSRPRGGGGKPPGSVTNPVQTPSKRSRP